MPKCKICENQKASNLGPKMLYSGIFLASVLKTTVVFEMTPLELVKPQIFVEKNLEFGTKNAILESFFGVDFKKLLSYLKSAS